MAYLTNFEIGTSMAAMVNVESLASAKMPPPRAPFSPYSGYITLADGSERGIGFPKCEWNFGVLTQAQRDALRTYCAGASAGVYIRTKINENDAFKYYQAIMVWPREYAENRDFLGTRVDFVIQFRMLVVQPDPDPEP
jgi:hypothetical protein